MTETPNIRDTAEYKLGVAEGNAKKWKHIREIMGGIGLFLFIFGLIVVPDLYSSYNNEQDKQAKIHACSHASNVTACIQAIK